MGWNDLIAFDRRNQWVAIGSSNEHGKTQQVSHWKLMPHKLKGVVVLTVQSTNSQDKCLVPEFLGVFEIKTESLYGWHPLAVQKLLGFFHW